MKKAFFGFFSEISVVDETPPEIQRRIGNHDNPIVVEHHDRNEVQIVERQVPPFFFPHLIFRPERPPPPLQQPGNNQVRRRRAQPQAGIPFPIQNNNRCFHCGRYFACVSLCLTRDCSTARSNYSYYQQSTFIK